MAIKVSPMRKFKQAMSKIVLGNPFYASLILGTNITFTEDVPTMGTDGVDMFVNLNFVDSIEVSHVIGVIVHEVLHMIYFHANRKGERDHKIFNAAADYAINPIVKASGYTLPTPHLDDDKFHKMTAEQIYSKLMKEKPPMPEGVDYEDVIVNKSSAAEKAKQEQKVKVNVTKAMNTAGSEVPEAIKATVEKLLEPKIDWKEQLREFIQTSLGTDEHTWKKPNRNYIHDDLYIPSLHGNSIPSIAVLLDTSGSIYSQKELFNEFCSEVNKIVEDLSPEQVDVFYVDTQIRRHDTYTEGEVPEYTLEGGGGTDFREAWLKIEESDPSCIIAFTDLWAALPNQSCVETLWVCYENQNPEAPFGKIIKVEGN